MKKIIIVLCCIFLVSGLFTACGGSENNSDPAESSKTADQSEFIGEKKVVIGLTDDPNSLGPWDGLSGSRSYTIPYLYQPLLTNYDGEIFFCIAESRTDDDDLHTTIKLREGIKDTNGNPITSEDVVFSYEKSKELGNDRNINHFKSAEIIDELTVRFTWNESIKTGLGTRDNALGIYIVSKASYEASGDGMQNDPVGTTPYKVTSYVSGSTLTMEYTGDYWNSDGETCPYYMSNVDIMEFDIIPEQAQHTTALKTENIDMTNNLLTQDLAIFQDGGQYSEQYHTLLLPKNETYVIYFNVSDNSLCKDIDLRTAIAYSYSIDAIIDGMFDGYGQRSNAPGGNPSFFDYQAKWDDEEYFDYNEEKSQDALKKYLEKTNKKASDITVKIGCEASDQTVRMGEVLQGYLLKLGINCELVSYASSSFREEMLNPDNVDMFFKAAGGSTYCAGTWNVMWKEEQAWTTFADDDEELQALFDVALNEDTYNDETVNQLRDYINQQVYACGVCETLSTIVYPDYVTKVVATTVKQMIVPNACEYDWTAR